MNNLEAISSLQNARVKQVCLLQQKSQERRRTGCFVVEGQRELCRCVAAGYEIEALFLCPELAGDFVLTAARQSFCVSPVVYEKMAYRGSTEGALAIVCDKPFALQDIPMTSAPLIVVLESVEKPGNLGAVLRSADAAGATAVVVCDERCDLNNPNVIRSSAGTRFSVPCVACTTQACIDFLKARGVRILTAQLQDSTPYYAQDLRQPTALVFGTESTGLTPAWRRAADAHIRIPMHGIADSLNVSVSAAVLLFEAERQRQETLNNKQ